jgi:hypothetical protein
MRPGDRRPWIDGVHRERRGEGGGRGYRVRPGGRGGAHQPGAAGPFPAGAGQPLTVPGILPGTESAARPEWPGSRAAGADDIPQGLAAGQGRDGGIWIGSARHVTVFQGISSAVARSAYLEQVRRIAPPDPPGLLDRDAELAELARFCLDPEGAPYTWWRAGPWAGKSALLSTCHRNQHPLCPCPGRDRALGRHTLSIFS